MKTKTLIGIFLICSNLFAQDWSLQKCIDYACQNRFEIKTAQLNVESQTKQYQYSKHLMLPDLASEYNLVNTSGRNPNINTNQWEDSNLKQGYFSLNANWELFGGLQILHRIKQNGLLKERYVSDIDNVKFKIRIEVTQAYYEVLNAKANANIAQNFIDVTGKQIQSLQVLINTGKKSRLDMLELEAKQEQHYSMLVNAKRQEVLAVNKLLKSMNCSNASFVNMDTQFIKQLSLTKVNADSIFGVAIQNVPSYKISKIDSSYKSLVLKEFKGKYAPKVKLWSTLTSLYQKDAINMTNPKLEYGLGRQLQNNYNARVGLTLSVPIYSRFQVKSLVTDKKYNFQSSILESKKTYATVYFDIKALCEEFNVRLDNMEHLAKRKSKYEEIYELRLAQYHLGAYSITDLLTILSNRINANLELNLETYQVLLLQDIIEIYTHPID